MKKFIIIIAALLAVGTAGAQGSIYSKVILPTVPLSLDFAGERVPLENYDTRESLQRELLVTTYMHSRTYQTLLNTKRYFAVIEPILKKHGIPEDFKYLCMAESALNPNAVSSAGAAGLWQIMPATGKVYGLTTGKEVDERFDLEKSTEAACRILLDNYKNFKSWTLAAAAYNLGPAGVSKRLKIQGVNDYYDAFFPEETLRYIFRVLSFKMLCADPYGYGYVIGKNDFYKPLTDYKTVEVKGEKIDWSQVAKDNGTTYKMLRQLNHWIRDYEHTNKAGKVFKVKIPNPGFRQWETPESGGSI